MRDDAWLTDRFHALRLRHFPDVPPIGLLLIKFGRPARTRLGSIAARQYRGGLRTVIRVNGALRLFEAPEYVIDAVLLHEYSHYAHGFHSGYPRAHRHPHRGGVVDSEIISRGGGGLLAAQQAWMASEGRRFLSLSV